MITFLPVYLARPLPIAVSVSTGYQRQSPPPQSNAKTITASGETTPNATNAAKQPLPTWTPTTQPSQAADHYRADRASGAAFQSAPSRYKNGYKPRHPTLANVTQRSHRLPALHITNALAGVLPTALPQQMQPHPTKTCPRRAGRSPG